MAREDLHFRLRIPDGLKQRIELEAQKERRSMTAEIVARLEKSFDSEARSEEVQNIILDLQGRLAIMTTMANVRLQTIETFVRHLASSEEARAELWSAVRSGSFNSPDSLEEK